MILKEKTFLWYLTFPFAHRNYTTIGKTIYYPKDHPPTLEIVAHESIHFAQQTEVGFVKYLFLYLFCLPFLYNPWRYKWEFEAYTKGSGYSEEQTKKILKSYKYGWLWH